ncbi:hypothetical protein LL270_09160 [Pseudomonas aestusnigri]|uniref:hypothetical protein n=1 Tax=Halopseudomonas aestusnigri TaxID=857252 RepID=UPI001D1887BA|nr:hypothetical protein [Halopseudomonas aestusnigri]MCC4260823.1 hypothetical protein [Halopseudomonas aestusnigri]
MNHQAEYLEEELRKARAEVAELRKRVCVPDVSTMARVLSDRVADARNIDRTDNWAMYGGEYIEDVQAMLAAAAPVERVEQDARVFWVLFDKTGDVKYIKKDSDAGTLAFFDNEEDAARAKRFNPGTDYKRVEYYTTPQPAPTAAQDVAEQPVMNWRNCYHRASMDLCAIGELLGVPEEDQCTPEIIEAIKALQQSNPPEQVEPAAWMHDSPGRVDVISAEVKKLLVDSHDTAGHLHRPLDKSEHYTIPLYTHPAPCHKGDKS